MILSRDVRHVNADLAVLDLAVPTAPLPRHAHTLGPLLGKRRGVEHEHTIRLAKIVADLTGQGQKQRRMLPSPKPDEFLKALTILVVEVGDSFTGLVIEF